MKSDAVTGLVSQLKAESNPLSALNLILDKVKSRLNEGSENTDTVVSRTVVNRELVESVVAELSKNEEDLEQESLRIIETHDMPLIRYDLFASS